MFKPRLFALFAVSAASLAAPAMASETLLTFPGAACQTLSNAATISRNVLGQVQNTGTANQTVICPVTQVEPVDLSSMEAARVVGSTTISCTAVARNSAGAVVSTTAPNNIVPIGGGLNNFQFGAGLGNVTAAHNGVFYFNCTLPPNTVVVNYAVIENLNEN